MAFSIILITLIFVVCCAVSALVVYFSKRKRK
jgi:hypothetical protein